jgi:hypothetical protein
MIPIEIDLERVKRSRENGILRLGQPLKSFRDRNIDFSVYDKNKVHPYLDSLGALIKPTRMNMQRINDVLQSNVPDPVIVV